MGDWAIAQGSVESGDTSAAGLSLLFATGDRPRASGIARLIEAPEPGDPPARISHSAGTEDGWTELLASGLTFDLRGLAPASAAAPPPADYFFGLPPDVARFEFEAVTLQPTPHIAAGAALLPVVRVMTGLAARLSRLPAVKAVCWHPAASWMDPTYFRRLIGAWLAGGAFPALGLTVLRPTGDGFVQSRGLSFFIGQELELQDVGDGNAGAAIKVGVRIVDGLVRGGPILTERVLGGPIGEELWAEPSPDGKLVRVGPRR